jgi:penicillin G amidase
VSGLWRWVKRVGLVVLVVLLILVVATAGLFTWLVARGMPQRDGVANIPGLSASVRVVRDQNGIANIYASTTEDLFAAQGYVHASERMWQMEVWRRIGAGRLSELFGTTSLDNDRYIRMLGWRAAAEKDWTVMSDAGKVALEAYSRGVNAWIDQHGDLPLPFVIAGLQGAGGGLSGFRPEPWTPVDTLTWQKVQAWSLGDNYGSELLRTVLLKRGLTPDQIDQLNPAYDSSRPVIATQTGFASAPAQTGSASSTDSLAMDAGTASSLMRAGDALRSELALAGAGPDLAGSNGFVVAGSRSATGGALLANDPHLDISMPSVWYLVGLHCAPISAACPYELAGAGFPGVPGIVLGHNDRIAWGLTNVGPDVQDVFEERVDPADPTHYMYKGQSLPFDVRHETIKVSGGDPVTLDVRSTVHGPVVSDLESVYRPTSEDGGAGAGQPGYVYTLAWTATMQPDRTLDSVLAVNRAQNWNEFRDALRNFGAPSQTFLYADVEGNIGVQVPGLFPIRVEGNGAYPVPGEDGTHDWTGFVPFDQLPYVYNPSSGLIVASNNQPAPADSPVFIGQEFDPGWRAARIHELLDPGNAITTDQLRAVQGDVKLTRAAPVIAALPGVKASTADGELLRQRLLDWSALSAGRVPSMLECTTDSLGCAGYENFEYWLERGVFDDELGGGRAPTDGSWRYVGNEQAHELLTRLVSQPDSPWWDDTTTSGTTETRDQIIAAALDKAAADLRTSLGDPANWTWGRIHTVTFQEQTLGTSGIGPLEWIFNKGPYPAPGSCTTVDKICGSIAQDWPLEGEKSDLQLRFSAASSPSYRLVIDMSALDGATIIQTTGQSGVPFDAHYGDFIDRWLSNSPAVNFNDTTPPGYVPLYWTDTEIDGAGRQTLTLQP